MVNPVSGSGSAASHGANEPLPNDGHGSAKPKVRQRVQAGAGDGSSCSVDGISAKPSKTDVFQESSTFSSQKSIEDFIENSGRFGDFISAPKGKCEGCARAVMETLKGQNVQCSALGVLMWRGAADTIPDNHFAVLARIGGRDIVIDPTISQFDQGIEKKVFSKDEWEQEIASSNPGKRVEYKVYQNVSAASLEVGVQADPSLVSFRGEALSEPQWYRRALKNPEALKALQGEPELKGSKSKGSSSVSFEERAQKKADKAAAKAEKQAEKAAAKEAKLAEKAEAKAQKQAEKAEAKAQKEAAKAEAKAQKQAEKAENIAALKADIARYRFNPAQEAAKPKRMSEEAVQAAVDAALSSADARDKQKSAELFKEIGKLSVFQQADQAKWKSARDRDYAKDVPPPPQPAPRSAFGRAPQAMPSIPENSPVNSVRGASEPGPSTIPDKMRNAPNPPSHDPMGSTLAVNAAPDAPDHNPWGSTVAVNNAPNPPRHEPGAQEEPRVPPMMERWAQNR